MQGNCVGEVTYLFCALNCFVSGPFQYISSVCVCVWGVVVKGGELQGQAKHIQFKYANVIAGSRMEKQGGNKGEHRAKQVVM